MRPSSSTRPVAAKPSSSRIRIAVRVRPLSAAEAQRGHACVIERVNDTGVRVWDPTCMDLRASADQALISSWSRDFFYDHCLWSVSPDDSNYANQQSIFDAVGRQIVDFVLDGFNTCAGKSYTMLGSSRETSQYGLIPRVCFALFEDLEQASSDMVGHEFTVDFSYLEIYNETLKDCLSPGSNKGELKLRESRDGVMVTNTSTERVHCFEDVMSLIAHGNKYRTVAATNANARSSRSHAIVTLSVCQRYRSGVVHGLPSSALQQKTSRVHLVDLAGSERQSHSGATGIRLREANNINKSLSVLGDVIKCLGEGKGHVPYRNSILTMVLKESLGGNSHTAIVANVSPSSDNYDETISTLKYADSAKRIRMRVAANVTSGLGATDGSTAMQLVPLLQAEVAKLKELLKTQESYNMQISRAEFNDKQAETEDVLEMKARVHELENQLKDREDLIKSFSDSAHDHAGRSSQKNTPEKKSFLQPLVLLSDDAVDTTVPRIVNLNQDPLFSECLVYYIPSGFATAGSDEAEVDIFLSGPDLLSRHCVFHNHAGAVTIGPLYSASAEEMIDGVGQIFVNGVDLRSAASVHDGHIVRLNHFDRVAIGRFHLFRFEAAGMHRAHSTSSSPIRGVHGGSPVGSIPDWEFAQNELMQKSPKYFQGIALPNFASDPIPQSLIFQPKPKLETGKKKFELQGPTKSILRNSEDYRRVRFSENVVLEKMETYNRSTEVRGHMEGHKHAEVDITSTAPAPVVRQDNSYWSRMERIVQGTEKAANPAELRSMMRAALDMTTSDLSGPSGRYSGPNATFEVAPIKGTGATTVAAPIYTTSPIKAPPPPSTYSPRQHQTQVVSHIIPPVPPVRKIDRPKPAEVIQKPVFAPAEVYHVQDVREQLPTNLDKDVVHNGEKFDSEVLALQSELAQMQKNLQDRMQRYRNMGKR